MRRGSRRRRRQAAAKRRAHSRKKRQFRQKSEHSQPAEKDNIEKPYPLSAIKEVPVCIDDGGALDGHSGKDDSGNSKDQHAALVQPDRPWNSSCDEQRRGKSEEILLVRGGVESNPGPKNLAEKMGWEDDKCVGRSQGEGAPNDEWYFTMKQQQATDKKQQEKEAQKQRIAKAKEEKNEAAQLAWLESLGEKPEEKVNNQEEEQRMWHPESAVNEDIESWNLGDYLLYYQEEKKRSDKKEKAKEKKKQDIDQYWNEAVEKRRKEESKKKMVPEKEETEDLSKEDNEEKCREMEEPPIQTENTKQPMPQVTVLIYMIWYYFY